MNFENIIRLLEMNIEKIRGYGVRRIGLFGSYSRGEQTETSDMDILVEFEDDEKTFDNYMDLKFFLEDLFGLKVDLVMEGTIKPDLLPYILGSVKYAAGI